MSQEVVNALARLRKEVESHKKALYNAHSDIEYANLKRKIADKELIIQIVKEHYEQ